jgi:sterol desaturase/sphingolipid hydroxylase (fatty acid hydroxylase superfamily)
MDPGMWRLAIFVIAFAGLGVMEFAWPRRAPRAKRLRRWSSHLTLAVLNSLAIRLLFPVTAVGWAAICAHRQWGLLQQVEWPGWLEIILAVVGLDLLIYWQHRVFHAWSFLWCLHQVHHADVDVDVSTGIRFHTIEMLLSQGIKLAGIGLLGASPYAVLAFEIILNLGAMWSHTNVSLPPIVDRIVRWFVVTPDMHRVHHSVDREESNRNFGFHLPWWDWLFHTYQAQPKNAHASMELGLPGRAWRQLPENLLALLRMPFAARQESGSDR